MAKAKVSDLTSLYNTLLTSVGCRTDQEGLVSLYDPDTEMSQPISIGDKRLALPTPERLSTGDWEGKIAFHPMAENIYRSDSKVLNKLKLLVNAKLSFVIGELLEALILMAADSDYHDKLNPKQADFLTKVKSVDQKAVKDFEKVLDKVTVTKADNRLISLFIKRSGKLDDTKYARVASVTFPVTEQFNEEDLTIFGVKFQSKKNFRAFVALFDYILPKHDSPHAYSAGSNAMSAPSLHALIMAFANVAGELNKTIKRFGKKHLARADLLHTDLAWVEDIGDLSQYRDLIPVLSGNDGEPVEGVVDPDTTTTPAYTGGPSQGQGIQAPSNTHQHSGVASGSGAHTHGTPPWDQTQPSAPAPSTGERKVSMVAMMNQHPAPSQQPQQPMPGWAGMGQQQNQNPLAFLQNRQQQMPMNQPGRGGVRPTQYGGQPQQPGWSGQPNNSGGGVFGGGL